MIPWSMVEVVFLPVSTSTLSDMHHCPICLDTPHLAKMTNCGHIFCFTCILRCMNGEIYCKCPMCSEILSREHLKPVRNCILPVPIERQEFALSLLYCQKGSISPIIYEDKLAIEDPNTQNKDSGGVVPLVSSPNSKYCRLAIMTPEDIITCLNLEIEELQRLREVSLDTSSDVGDVECLPFITEAVYLIEEKKRLIMIQFSGPDKDTGIVTKLDGVDGSDGYLFYQSSEGSLVFLHPLCYKCLLCEANQDPALLPKSLNSKVIEVERLRVTKAIKSRLPFLRHLPENCDITLVEIELKDLVSRAILQQFKAEFQKRMKARKQREKEAIYNALSEEESKAAQTVMVEELKKRYQDMRAKEAAVIEELLQGPVVGQDNLGRILDVLKFFVL